MSWMIVRVTIGGVEVKSIGDIFDGLRMARLRSKAHNAFDPLWKDGFISRNKAYRWLCNTFGEDTHFSTMSKHELEKAVDLCNLKHEEFIKAKLALEKAQEANGGGEGS